MILAMSRRGAEMVGLEKTGAVLQIFVTLIN